jgi:2-polyprenyl-6-methoxyphenol hydroxylase-like FAD-dependent oxidoreductase
MHEERVMPEAHEREHSGSKPYVCDPTTTEMGFPDSEATVKWASIIRSSRIVCSEVGSTMKILIIGAGIAGLAMARALELRGYNPEIIERRPGSPMVGQGIFLLGNATRALGDLSLIEKIRGSAYPIEAQRILTSRGRILNDVDTHKTWGECGPCLALPRQTLVEILSSALEQTRVVYNNTATLSMIEGTRKVRFADGRNAEYDLVIGADGVHSQVRSSAFSCAGSRSLGLACWRMMVPNSRRIDAWTAMLGSKRTLLAIPIDNENLYLYADCPVTEYGDGSLTVLKGLFADFCDPVGPLIESLDSDTIIHSAYLEEVPAQTFVSDRVALIGDAAHASSPSMAQGAALALEDALVLAAALHRERSVPQALASYSNQRMARVQWVQSQCKARDKMRVSPRLLRNAVLHAFGTALYKRSYEPLSRSLPFPGA